MKRFLLLASLFVSLSMAQSVFAAGYGAAGCGLGAMIFGDEPGIVQIFASTTNGTAGNQTFGITSGTSNCESSGLVMLEKEQELFVEQNFDSLAKDMAIGNGESLATLSFLLGCQSSTEQLGAFTQENYEKIYKDGVTPVEMLNSIKSGIQNDSNLSASCGDLAI